MTIANKAAVAAPTAPPGRAPIEIGSRLSPAFRVEMRNRVGDPSIQVATVYARTIASARHTARLTFPDMVVTHVSRA